MPIEKVCSLINKNDNIHKNEVQITDDQTNIDKYRVAANITEYHILFYQNYSLI